MAATTSSLRRLALLAIIGFFITVFFLVQKPYDGVSGSSWSQDAQSEDESSREKTPLNPDHIVPFVPETYGPPKDEILKPATTLLTSVKLAKPTNIPSHSPVTADVSTTAPSEPPAQTWSWEYTQGVIKSWVKTWPVPAIEGHWPPYEDYRDEDYDPNLWEGFLWNNEIYINSGIRLLVSDGEAELSKVEPYMPYPAYNTESWQRQWRGTYTSCEGPRGKLLNASDEDIIKAYPALPTGFPSAAIGYTNLTGFSVDAHCFDRHHRYGPYGFGQGEREDAEDWQEPTVRPDWTSVNWQKLQDKCLMKNKDRYKPKARQPPVLKPGKDLPSKLSSAPPVPQLRSPDYHSRTAILVRAWEGLPFGEDELQNMRALITELSLHSGGEFQVFILYHIEDENMDIWKNQELYKDSLHDLPRELQSISILWNSKLCHEWYPKIGDCNNFWHPYIPLQWFSLTHPEFDFVWNWEADVRYTGNYYELLDGVASFARNSSRKYMWERNQRFYVPSAHGSYEDFLNSTYEAADRATEEGEKSPWGKNAWNDKAQRPIGPTPPRSIDEDDFEWGVGEDADLITFQPIWDPREVDWTFKEKIWNFLPGFRPTFTEEDPMAANFRHSDFGKIPRRTTIGSHLRLSARQLYAMHLENLAGRTMAAEMWPATVALHHGLKAVYAPHPVWTDRVWPAWYLDAVLNANRGEDARWGQKDDSIWVHDRSHNLAGTSWFVEADFPKTLYRRWLGLRRIDGSPLAEIDGKQWEDEGMTIDLPVGENGGEQEVRVGGHGRMCLPPMLLHLVKDVYDEAIPQQVSMPPPPPAEEAEEEGAEPIPFPNERGRI
ncbi:hypothetical protein M409DRAFT_51057 [Zasmidium cellare ATCC 36951]|uniref:Uncharacterized protein n=1 Tax=Zasmidium cellare ATCC 36951 TaxID=1080233 RepID=A0A6A6CUM5_ZASCE|nr:uncharacterized protein M409DRAFT_51057 [Zasmidium cellare ATCC 36951]KAF2170801.1 hypothetical protein M409DRAFT_51057 [Zasmidium cellare ATCC 36951]